MRWSQVSSLAFSVACLTSLYCNALHAQLTRCTIRQDSFLSEKKSNDELNRIAALSGLKPVPHVINNRSRRLGADSHKNKRVKKVKRPAGSDHWCGPTALGDVPVEVQLEYARSGCGVLKSFLDPTSLEHVRTDLLSFSKNRELEAWRQKVEVASDDPNRARACRTIQDCKRELRKLQIALDKLPFLQYFNTWRHVQSVKDLAFSLGQTASILMDVQSVRLYQDALFTKRKGDGPTPWHTDARMAPFDTSNMITFWIPLQSIPRDGTALIFVPKSHCDFALPFWNSFDGTEFDRLEERYKCKTVHYMPLPLGDVTVHTGWTLHCADGNDSDDNRCALAISYVDAQAEIRETALDFSPSKGGAYGDNEDHWSYREWVTKVAPRKRFGSHPLVPIVWPRS